MVEIFTYYTELPPGVNEMVAPCYDGYTIYVDSHLSGDRQYKAWTHAVQHIMNCDFDKTDVDAIERGAHQ